MNKDFEQAKAEASEFCGNLARDFAMYKDDGMAKKATAIQASIGALKSADEGIPALTEKEGELTSLFVNLTRTAVETYTQDAAALELPLGWSRDWTAFRAAAGKRAAFTMAWHKMVGLTLTIFLITFGAPFWNDVLAALSGVKNKLGKTSGT